MSLSTPNFVRVNKFIFKKIEIKVKNKVKQNFLQIFSNFNFIKKRRKNLEKNKRKKKKKKEEESNLLWA